MVITECQLYYYVLIINGGRNLNSVPKQLSLYYG